MAKKVKKLPKQVVAISPAAGDAVDALTTLYGAAREQKAKKTAKLIGSLIRSVRKLDKALSREIAGGGKREAKRNKVAQKIAALKATLKSL